MNHLFRRILNDDGLLFVLLGVSLVGHVCLGLITLPDDESPKVPDRQSGRTSVSVQLVSLREPARLEIKQDLQKLPELLAREDAQPNIDDFFVPRNDERRTAEEIVPDPIEQKTQNERTPIDNEVAQTSAEAEIPEAKSEQDLESKESSGAEVPPSFVSRTQPRYPRELLLQGTEGRVMLLVTVGKNGRAVQLSVDKSSGYKEMDDSAIAAVKLWQFSPATRGGNPIAKRIKIPVSFVIRR